MYQQQQKQLKRHKNENNFASKNTNTQVKRQFMEQKTIFINLMYDKGLVPRICKDLLQFDGTQKFAHACS